MTRLMVAAVGDANDPATWSGTPWHCIEAGRALGLIDGGLALSTADPKWKFQRAAFSLSQLARGRGAGGFQYSERFLASLFARDPLRPGDAVLNMFQLYPSSVICKHDGPLWFYVDQTLNQLFPNYGVRASRQVLGDAMARERVQYNHAAGVIGLSRYAARDVIETYGVPADKVHVVLPGANISRNSLSRWEARSPGLIPSKPPLRLVFVGKDWQRKGLDRLVRALTAARAAGANAELLIVGVARQSLPLDLAAAPGLTFAGFIDKQREPDRFVELIGGCHVGCLLSRAEAGGISLREFQRVGLVTIAPDVGGNPEYLVPGAGHRVAPRAPDADIASIIYRLATEPGYLDAQREVAWAARDGASWDVAVKALARIVRARQHG